MLLKLPDSGLRMSGSTADKRLTRKLDNNEVWGILRSQRTDLYNVVLNRAVRELYPQVEL